MVIIEQIFRANLYTEFPKFETCSGFLYSSLYQETSERVAALEHALRKLGTKHGVTAEPQAFTGQKVWELSLRAEAPVRKDLEAFLMEASALMSAAVDESRHSRPALYA